MGIKETPTNFRTYYKTMHNSIRPKYEEAVDKYEKLIIEEKAIHSELLSLADDYKTRYKFDFSEYDELLTNSYIDGTFYNHAKSLFINKKENYKAKSSLYNLYTFARKQKELHELKHQISIWEKMLFLYQLYRMFYQFLSFLFLLNSLNYLVFQFLNQILDLNFQ
jgi:hypothetical protein